MLLHASDPLFRGHGSLLAGRCVSFKLLRGILDEHGRVPSFEFGDPHNLLRRPPEQQTEGRDGAARLPSLCSLDRDRAEHDNLLDRCQHPRHVFLIRVKKYNSATRDRNLAERLPQCVVHAVQHKPLCCLLQPLHDQRHSRALDETVH